MNIGVLGCGSLGGVIAARLWRYYPDTIVVFELDPHIVQSVRENGLQVNDTKGSFVATPRVETGPEGLSNSLDLVILTTKSTSLTGAVEAYLPALADNGCFMTVQNGLMALDLVQRYATRVIGLKDGELVYEGSKEDIIAMTDEQFKDIYGQEAERVGGGLEGDLSAKVGGAA